MNRRTQDFFQSKHGQGILNALKGKWSDAAVTKYFDSLHRGSDVKWERAMGFIANAAGVNAKTFETWDEGERLLMRQIKKLYIDYKSTTESMKPLKLKQIIQEEVRRQLNEAGRQFEVDDRVKVTSSGMTHSGKTGTVVDIAPSDSFYTVEFTNGSAYFHESDLKLVKRPSI